MAAAAVLFFAPALFCLVALQFHPQWAHSIFGSAQLAEFEKMYDPANHRIGRSSGTDLAMFGHYVMNNVSIAFRTFASGLALGVGAVYVLAANGVIIGGVAGHLTQMGYGGPFWRFVAAHAAFELTALVIAGGAGLKLGLTLLAPGRQRRGPAMVAAGWIGAQLALGAFAMAGLSVEVASRSVGARLQRRRGEGTEFHELRDYRIGDSLRKIDWKATARVARLVSREYRDERNQQVVLLLDCGRRMAGERDVADGFRVVRHDATLLC